VRTSLEPGQPASLVVTFIEERQGRAIVRLPNGSKTTIGFDSLRPRIGRVHFARRQGGGEDAWCLLCDWHAEAATRILAEDEFDHHAAKEHPTTPPQHSTPSLGGDQEGQS